MSITNNLQIAKSHLLFALKELETNPKQDSISELLDAIEVIEENYRDRFCPNCNSDFDEKKGDTYENGISLEFYIESAQWHDISKAFRKLRPPEDDR